MSGRFAPRGLLAVLIALTASAVLAGCASVPSSFQAQVPTAGPIEQGEQVGVQGEDQFIRVIAREPRPGMTPQEVVQGFLDASASFDGDHAVAREYLTPQASAEWDTDEGVTVYEGAANLTELGSAVVMAAAQAGTIARNGRYEVKGPAAEFRTTFFLDRVGGEWRIRDLPDGLLLSLSDVDRAFRSFAVFFFNPSFTMLVPDPRMIPVVGPGLATTLIRRLVSGPTPWLQPAVRTGFPAGVGLNIDAVPIESGIARVDLTANAREADDETRQALSQQIVWTLRQLPEVQAVEITAAGQPLIVPGVPSPQPRDSWPAVDPNGMPVNATGYATRPEGVVRLVGESVEPVPGGAGAGDVTLIDVAVATDSQSLAGLDREGSVWQAPMIAGAPMIRIREPGEPTSLAFDGSSVWVVDAQEGLLALSGDGGADPITVSGLGKRAELLAAFPSRDGTRAALIIRRGPRTGILLARVIRETGSSARITIDAPVRIESRLVEVVDAAWSGSDTITVLGSESAGTLQAFDIDIARGTNSSLGSPEAPVSIGAAPGLPTLVGAADGLVYEATTGLWTGRVRGAAPTYPG